MRVALLLSAAALALAQADDTLALKSRQARELMAGGRFAEAIPVYEELTRALPANNGLRLNLALAYHMSGRHQDAVTLFERVLESDPNAVPALLSMGASRLALNQPDKAVAPLSKFVMLQPDHVPGRGMLANALLSLGRAKEAATHFRKLTTLTPDDPKAWYGLGRAYEALSRAAFDELDKTAQGSAAWLALVAESRLERRQYRSAFYFYRQALAKDPKLSGLHAGLAEVYRSTDHADWAAVEQTREAALKPDCVRDQAACAYAAGQYLQAASAGTPYWRARAYNKLALQAFSKLGSLRPSVELHSLKAEIMSQRGDHLGAVGEWRAAQKLAPGDPAIGRELAGALYAAKDHSNALPLLEKLLQQDSGAADLHFLIGDSWLQQGQPDKALPYLERAAKLDPAMLPARAALGMAYARSERPQDAIPHLTAALQLDEDGSLHFQLARAYQRSGNATEAQQLMAKYQELQRRSQQETQKLEQEAAITAP